MGTFEGHALPGSFFIVFAVWWAVQIYRRYFKSLEQNIQYRSSATYLPDFLPCKNIQLEGIVKVLCSTLGMVLEFAVSFIDGHFIHYGNGQHITMYFFFGLSGVVDILMQHGTPFPENTDYALGLLTFLVEDVLFQFHLHGRTELDVFLHILLLYVVHGCVLVTLIEMLYKTSPVIPLIRSFLLLFQGTWFWQVGFILYNPIPNGLKWQAGDHGEMMLVTTIFAWHAAVNFIIILIIGLLVRMFSTRCCSNMKITTEGGKYNYLKLISAKEQKFDTGANDSESEIEFLSKLNETNVM